MAASQPFVITISRQLGSGGAYLGQRLASRLCVGYADRDILRQAAERLRLSDEALEARDETLMSFWESLLQPFSLCTPEMLAPPETPLMPTDDALYQAESDIIAQIARERSAVIVGRGGFHILRRHPRHMSIFLHADMEYRSRQLQEAYKLSAPDAEQLIERTDRSRSRHLRAFTGRDWNDARQYDLCLDTGVLGLDGAEATVIAALVSRFGSEILPGADTQSPGC